MLRSFVLANKVNDMKLIFIHLLGQFAPPVESYIIFSGKWKLFADQSL